MEIRKKVIFQGVFPCEKSMFLTFFTRFLIFHPKNTSKLDNCMENQIFSNYVNLSFFHILTAWKIEIAYTFCKLSLSSYRHNHFNITTDIDNLKSVFFWLTFCHTVRVITYCPSKCFSCIILLPFSISTRLSLKPPIS